LDLTQKRSVRPHAVIPASLIPASLIPIGRNLRYVAAMQRVLIAAGVILLVLGLLWPWLVRLGLGGLPGDISVQRPGFRFYAPLGSSLLISVVLSLALTLIVWLMRR
jgi:hypothetical protein